MYFVRSAAMVTLALLGGPPVLTQVTRLERQVLAMGTTLGIDLSGPEASQLQTASEKAFDEVARIERNLSTWREDSVFSRLNQARGAAVPLEQEWLDLLRAVRVQAERTQGAFDPLLNPLVQAWGLRGKGEVPSRTALRAAREASGPHWLELDLARGTARLGHPEAGIEEGGFGKGYALDRAAGLAKGSGAQSGLLNFGGQLLGFGTSQTVSISDPTDRIRARVSLRLENASLASSGTSEKGRHILNPRTGDPCPAWGSVSVVASSGLEADCLSTALYVMGPRLGLRWAVAHQVSACFVPNNGRIRMSPAFRALAPVIH